MVNIALLPDDAANKACYLQSRLPARYMEDYSLAGLVVNRYHEACALLAENGYQLNEQCGGMEISLTAYHDLLQVVSLLGTHRIHCEMSDIADTIYQA